MSGAGYSRVTHPFAARVPQRAFPLDLHVLSTPPAFVLSQDQTLQKNLKTRQAPKKQEAHQRNHPKMKKTIGTGITSTLLSSQRTSTHQKLPDFRRESFGGYSSSLPGPVQRPLSGGLTGVPCCVKERYATAYAACKSGRVVARHTLGHTTVDARGRTDRHGGRTR